MSPAATPLTEAELDAGIRAQREAAADAAEDALDHARCSDYPNWSDELDAIDRSTAPLRNLGMALVAVGLVGTIVVATFGPALWHLFGGAFAQVWP
jgi:hypothetical protein